MRANKNLLATVLNASRLMRHRERKYEPEIAVFQLTPSLTRLCTVTYACRRSLQVPFFQLWEQGPIYIVPARLYWYIFPTTELVYSARPYTACGHMKTEHTMILLTLFHAQAQSRFFAHRRYVALLTEMTKAPCAVSLTIAKGHC